jgi:hypothetical protein
MLANRMTKPSLKLDASQLPPLMHQMNVLTAHPRAAPRVPNRARKSCCPRGTFAKVKIVAKRKGQLT